MNLAPLRRAAAAFPVHSGPASFPAAGAPWRAGLRRWRLRRVVVLESCFVFALHGAGQPRASRARENKTRPCRVSAAGPMAAGGRPHTRTEDRVAPSCSDSDFVELHTQFPLRGVSSSDRLLYTCTCPVQAEDHYPSIAVIEGPANRITKLLKHFVKVFIFK